MWLLRGLQDGSLLGGYYIFGDSESEREEYVVHLSAAGEQLATIVKLPQFDVDRNFGVPHPIPSATAARSGEVYMTPALEYEVFSFSLAGEMDWALRATWQRTPITQDVKDQVRPYQQKLPEGAVPEIQWPEEMPALSYVRVDGHGHIYVVPYVHVNEIRMLGLVTGRAPWQDLGPPPEPAEFLPVDVYSPEGELLFAGMMESAGQHWIGWDDALGDHVYRVSRDWETGERFLERLRLVEPFE
jgi:hypothetical protein